MAKEFQKKYMHPTRRKLVDMVMTGGEYDKDTFVSYSPTVDDVKREVGEIWTDTKGVTWKQHSYGRVQQSDLTDTMKEVRSWLQKRKECKNETCSKNKYGYTDKQLIKKTGYCVDCLVDKEAVIKTDGLWIEYSQYRMAQNMISHGNDVLQQLYQAYNEVSDVYEIVNEDGSIESWKTDKNVDELKAEIMEDITKIQSELNDIILIRDTAWELLKDKNYDLVSNPIQLVK
jgi:hypothetical protein